KGRKTDLWLRQRENGVLGRNDEIASERNFTTTTHRHAIHGSNHRLVEVVARGETGKARLRHFDLVAFRLPAQVVTCAESAVALARDDGNPEVIILREIIEHLLEFEIGGRVQRIHAL